MSTALVAAKTHSLNLPSHDIEFFHFDIVPYTIPSYYQDGCATNGFFEVKRTQSTAASFNDINIPCAQVVESGL